ncbi:MAG: hypothetical protein JSS20_20600 [Proteobacteria bacterium]|nr:hypothetical protein [Pseudomonadota bacterium]
MKPRLPEWPPWPTSIDQALFECGFDPEIFPMGSGFTRQEASVVIGALEIIVRQSWPEQERQRAEEADAALAKIFPAAPPAWLRRRNGRMKR